MGNWFVLFVHTGSEGTVANYLNEKIFDEESAAFVPQVEMFYKNSKQIYKVLKPMFPGYVFVETSLDGKNFIIQNAEYVRKLRYIIKIMGKENPENMAVQRKEKDFLMTFCNNDYVVEESKGFIIGEKVFISSGPLMGKETIIKNIDRHKRIAEIDMVFFNSPRKVKLSLEVFSKI